MRDIGTRIQRYRLSRYGSPVTHLRRLRWVWPLLVLWLIYAGVLGEHSWFRIWRMSRESEHVDRDLATRKQDLAKLEYQLHDATARRQAGEKALRERNGFAAKDETVYRFTPPDSFAN